MIRLGKTRLSQKKKPTVIFGQSELSTKKAFVKNAALRRNQWLFIVIPVLIVIAIAIAFIVFGAGSTKTWDTDTDFSGGTLNNTVVTGTGTSAKLQLSSTGGGNIYYMSASGSGSACTQVAPCSNIDTAYHTATPGSTVLMAAGSYSTPTIAGAADGGISNDASKVNATSDVTFQPQNSGDQVAFPGGLSIYATHLNIKGICCDVNLAIQAGAQHVTIENWDGKRFFIYAKVQPLDPNLGRPTSYITIKGGDWGPLLGPSDCGAGGMVIGDSTSTNGTVADHITIDGIYLHDSGSVATCPNGAHQDCLHIFYDTTYTTVKNSKFIRCFNYDILADSNQQTATPENYLFENNFFNTGLTGTAAFALRGDTVPANETFDNVTIRNNSATDTITTQTTNVLNNVLIANNVAPSIGACRATYSHNIITASYGSACDPTDKKIVSQPFVNPATGNANDPCCSLGDLHLTAGAAGIDYADTNVPSTDIDGKPRPIGAASDAGASEFGSAPTANYYVSTSGSDSNPCSQAAPCASFNRAYSVASGGQTIEVADGSYPSQTINYSAGKGTNPIIFQPSPSSAPCTGIHHQGFSSGFAYTPCAVSMTDLTVAASYVTVRNMSLTNGFDIENSAHHSNTVVLDNTHSTSGFMKADNSTIENGEIGGRDVCNTPGPDDGLDMYWYTSPNAAPTGTTVTNMLIHDVYDSDNNGGAGNGCNRGAHIDCVQMSDENNWTFTRNHVWNCATSGIITSCTNLCGQISGQYVANNMFGTVYSAGSTMNVGRNSDNIGGCVVEYNTVTTNSAGNEFGCSGTPAMIIRGNLLFKTYNCETGQSGDNADYNIYMSNGAENLSCGTHVKNCDPAWANPSGLSAGDGSILATDTCVVGAGSPGNAPAIDFYGNSRPNPFGSTADAGADEIGPSSGTPTTYAASGTEVLSFDAGQTANWSTLTSNQSAPTGTTVLMESRSSADNSTWSSYASGVSSTPSNRYIQVRITLSTSNNLVTPTVDSVSLGYAFSSDTTPPSTPTALHTTAVTSTSVALAWTASTDDTAVTGYKVYRAGTLVGSPSATSYTDSGLSPNTAYSYTVSAVDAAGNESTQTAALPVTTSAPPADTIAPTVPTALHTTATSSSAVSIAWTASTDNIGVTGYKVYRGGTLVASPSSTNYTDNAVTVGTTYVYTVSAVDAATNQSAQTSGLSVLVPDTVAPTVSITAPAAGTVSGTVTVTASAADNVGVVGVQFKLDGANLSTEDTSNPYSISWNSTTATNGSHTITATARDAATNSATSSTVTVSVNNVAAPDTTAPTVPANIHSTATTSSSISLTWNASTDNVAVTSYSIYRDGVLVGTVASPGYTNTGLTASTSYSYTVLASDAAANHSAQSTAATISTAAATVTPPACKTADINCDGKVNFTDLSILLSKYNSADTSSDVNKNGKVDFTDLSILLSKYGL